MDFVAVLINALSEFAFPMHQDIPYITINYLNLNKYYLFIILVIALVTEAGPWYLLQRSHLR